VFGNEQTTPGCTVSFPPFAAFPARLGNAAQAQGSRADAIDTLRMRRRTLLAVPGAWVLGAASGHGATLPVEASHAVDFQRLASLSAPLQDARALGRIYLQDHPDEAQPDVLARLVAGSAWADALPLSPAAWKRAISDRQAVDFAAGDVVALDGWILSLTEARLCALALVAQPAC
jgi:hypothetical protein